VIIPPTTQLKKEKRKGGEMLQGQRTASLQLLTAEIADYRLLHQPQLHQKQFN